MSVECQGCGGSVSTRFSRVFGDRDDVVHRCPNCTSYSEIVDGAAAGLERSELLP